MWDDFDDTIVDDVAHRPWPMPRGRWIMKQTWHDLLFAHWPVSVERMRALVPAPLELDIHDGSAWIGIVPFHMTNVTLRGVPALPWIARFPELNVRTYVVYGGKRGVFFFSLDAASWLAVRTARIAFGLPYFHAHMRFSEERGSILYQSDRRDGRASFAASYRAVGSERAVGKGSIEEFLTERYCLYTVDRRARVRRLEIHHPLWRLQPAAVELRANTMTVSLGIALGREAPLLHFSKRQDMVGWPLERL